jgi:hypothetical protein
MRFSRCDISRRHVPIELNFFWECIASYSTNKKILIFPNLARLYFLTYEKWKAEIVQK